jgi:hypothetical protein
MCDILDNAIEQYWLAQAKLTSEGYYVILSNGREYPSPALQVQAHAFKQIATLTKLHKEEDEPEEFRL